MGKWKRGVFVDAEKSKRTLQEYKWREKAKESERNKIAKKECKYYE